jgi:hypothetical protein
MEDKGEWWRVWIQEWCIWYIVRNFVNATMYPHPAQQFKKINTTKDDLVYVSYLQFPLPIKLNLYIYYFTEVIK